MPVPATTGSFKTNLLDMAIGDYIAFKYAASSGAAGTFPEFGVPLATAQANEIPVAGAAAPNGYSYALKVAPGFLISDRVLQHSISHDALNAAKLIQGFAPFSILDYQAGTFTPSTPYTKTFSTPLTTREIGFRVPIAGGDQTLTEVKIYDETNTNIASQATVTKIGSPLLTGAGLTGLVDGDIGTYTWDNSADLDGALFSFGSLKKISKVEIYGHASYLTKQIYLVNTPVLVRSLTGGIAYLGADGLPKTANADLGCWPPVNEWDKYIVNSNLGGKITAGDDNVWHWNGLASWCQDTPKIGCVRPDNSSVSDATYRTLRAYQQGIGFDKDGFWFAPSSTANASIGFRPVFEFLETGAKASNLWY